MGTKLGAISSELGTDIVAVPLVVTDSKGTTFNIEYLASNITGAMYDRMDKASKSGTLTPVDAEAFIMGFVTKWDIEYNDKDEVIPLVESEIHQFVPFGVMLLAINAILTDLKPKKKK